MNSKPLSIRPYKSLLVCTHHRVESTQSACGGRGSDAILLACQQAVMAANLDISVKAISCFGHCNKGPNVRLIPAGAFFHHVDVASIAEIIKTIQQHNAAIDKAVK